MAAKTAEEKAAEAAVKTSEKEAEHVEAQEAADRKVAAAQAEKDAEETNARLAVNSAAAAQSEADNALREQVREELRQEFLREIAEKSDADPFSGQLVSTEHWLLATSAPNTAKSVSVRPVGWVGDAPLTVHEDRLDELIDALKSIKH